MPSLVGMALLAEPAVARQHAARLRTQETACRRKPARTPADIHNELNHRVHLDNARPNRAVERITLAEPAVARQHAARLRTQEAACRRKPALILSVSHLDSRTQETACRRKPARTPADIHNELNHRVHLDNARPNRAVERITLAAQGKLRLQSAQDGFRL